MKTITLIGMMGSGKTTLAKHLEGMLKIEMLDIDAIIEKEQHLTISEIFEKYGEEYFRKIEKDCIKNKFKESNQILSLGGGAFENSETRELILKNSNVIYLETGAETIFGRIKDDKTRPILNKNMTVENIKNIIQKREEHYKLAHFHILTDNKTLEQISGELLQCLNLQ